MQTQHAAATSTIVNAAAACTVVNANATATASTAINANAAAAAVNVNNLLPPSMPTHWLEVYDVYQRTHNILKNL